MSGKDLRESPGPADEALLLVRYGEIALKGRNRRFFLGKLTDNIGRQLGAVSARVSSRSGRIYVRVAADDAARALAALSRVMGVVGYGPAIEAAKDIKALEEACVAAAGSLVSRGERFKIEARRTDKSFPFNSYEIACRLGDVIRKRFPSLSVKLDDPDWVLNVEIRERAYLHGPGERGPGGLPVGTSGRGLLLLSGGIDSPVAGYLMAKRGLRIDSVYFHTPPFASEKALEKVKRLAAAIGSYQPVSNLFVVPFTEVQARIGEKAPAEAVTLLGRAAMMRIADRLAAKHRMTCLVTGECLGQVASQTVQSMAFTSSAVGRPVFRPLIGLDKVEIIALARSIATYETSILPYPDCCTLFAPENPITRPKTAIMNELFDRLKIGDLLEAAAAGTTRSAAAAPAG